MKPIKDLARKIKGGWQYMSEFLEQKQQAEDEGTTLDDKEKKLKLKNQLLASMIAVAVGLLGVDLYLVQQLYGWFY